MLLVGDLGNRYLLLALCVAGGLTLLGAIDDLVKLRSEKRGISARSKLAGQILVAAAAALCLYFDHAPLASGLVLPPPLNMAPLRLGIWFVPLAIVVMVGSSNAVNLTDGLDGLAGGCLLFATAAMTVVVYAAGHAKWAAYLNIPHISGCGELAILAAAMIGGVVGFLWFNCHPAQVFMGDTGSLPLGGLLGYMAVVARQELLLLIVGGVFVVEALSVILQVAWFKWRKRRIFRCAPVHHHFQFLGWPENKIVVRFWIAAALLRLAGHGMPENQCRRKAVGTSYGTNRQRGALTCRVGRAELASPTSGRLVGLASSAHPTAPIVKRQPIMKNTFHIVFAGGGTGGHLFPGLAVAKKLSANRPGVQITFVGTGKPLEHQHVSAAGFDYVSLPCRPLPRQASEAIPFIVENVAGYFAARRLLDEERVAGVVGLGGYASVPMGRAAARRRLPLVLLEQNVVPGRANRWLSRFASLVCTSFASTERQLRGPCPVRCTGNPIRSLEPAASLPLCATPSPRLVVLGGSGGARSLNENVPRALYKIRRFLTGWEILHLSGAADVEATRNLYRKFALPARVEAFWPELPELLAGSSLAICRAGGTTLAELAATATPAVLLPYPHAADDHQRKNADVFVSAGAAARA